MSMILAYITLIIHFLFSVDFDATFTKVSKWFEDLGAHPDYANSVKAVFPKDPAALLKVSRVE